MELALIVLLAFLIGATSTAFVAYWWSRNRQRELLRLAEVQNERVRFLEYLLLSQCGPRRTPPGLPPVVPAQQSGYW
jgi:hypothetical protein